MSKKKIGLIGFAGTTPSLNLQQENAGFGPEHFEWARGDYSQDVVVYCEQTIAEEKHDHASTRIGLLIEPPELRPWHYQSAFDRRREFDIIFTYSKDWLAFGKPFEFYPLGGSWLFDWDIHTKTKNVSIIPGHKNALSGHKLRHEAVAQLGEKMDVFPWGSLEDSKSPALKDYRYSVVIENSVTDFWFTEKLIDAFSQGTIPIYWGCPSIGKYFDDHGIVTFNSLADLRVILNSLQDESFSRSYYEHRMDSIRYNLSVAGQYASLENWLSMRYPQIFH